MSCFQRRISSSRFSRIISTWKREVILSCLSKSSGAVKMGTNIVLLNHFNWRGAANRGYGLNYYATSVFILSSHLEWTPLDNSNFHGLSFSGWFSSYFCYACAWLSCILSSHQCSQKALSGGFLLDQALRFGFSSSLSTIIYVYQTLANFDGVLCTSGTPWYLSSNWSSLSV